VKYQRDVHAPHLRFKSFKAEPHEIAERRRHGEVRAYWVKQLIEQQCYNRKASDRHKPFCVEQLAANEGLGEYGLDQGKQMKDSGNPGLEKRRPVCDPLRDS
jgi:hypothetical protein